MESGRNWKNQRSTLEIVFPYIAVFLIGLLIVLGVFLFAKRDGADPGRSHSDEETSSAGTETRGTIIPTEPTPPEETLPAISAIDQLRVSQLISRYYDAKVNKDVDTLNEIVDSDTPFSYADVLEQNQFISKYDNFSIITIASPLPDYYIVYVSYDMYFNGIATGAPSLNRFVVRKDSEELYMIFDRSLPESLNTYLQHTEQTSMVISLQREVEEHLKAACARDVNLEFIIRRLNGDEEKQSSSADASGEADAGSSSGITETAAGGESA